MKIGIDARTLMDERYSGVSEYALNLIKTILKLDRENEYRLFYNSAKDISSRIPKFTESNVGTTRYKYPNKFLNYFLFNLIDAPKIDKKLEADIFFMPHINFISLSGKARSFLTIHDLSFLRFPEYFSFRKNFWHRMINVKKLIKKTDFIIAVSENTKKDIIELCGVKPEKIKVIYSGIEDRFRVISDKEKLYEARKKYGLPEKFIFFLGTIEPRKNIEGLIKSYNHLRYSRKDFAEYALVIAGGKGWKSEKIFKEWENSIYKKDIIFLDYVDRNDKACLYNLASLFVYPSFYEGFGFPPLEAMACGIPTICSFASSLPEIAGDASLMVDPFNICDIAKAMEMIIADKELKNDLIQRGLENVKKFNWDNAARGYLDYFIEKN